MKEIILTQGKVALVDDEDFERLNQFKWCAAKIYGGNFYAMRDSLLPDGTRKRILMHRIIMNTPKGLDTDHINSDTLYNCRNNLRVCTHQQNMCNQRYARKNSKSGIRGVYWNKQRNKFHSQIMVNRKQIHLGYFDKLSDAIVIRKTAEEKHFGEFARI